MKSFVTKSMLVSVAILLVIGHSQPVSPVSSQGLSLNIHLSYSDPAWSPMGDQIAFTSGHVGDYGIWVVKTDGSNLTNLAAHTRSNNRLPKWSPDGRFIAFNSDRAGAWDVWLMKADGSDPTNLTANNTAHVVEYEWSPDGRFIAFISMTFGDHLSTNIWVTRPDGTHQINLTPEFDGFCSELSWSPDSRTVAFTVTDLSTFKRIGIWAVAIDGTWPTALTPGQSDLDVVWSPTSNVIAITNQVGASFDIWTVDLDSSTRVNLTADNPDIDSMPAWSPDGHSLAFVSKRNDRYGVWVMQADGSNPVNLTTNMDGVSSKPAWSPDGKRIVFEFYPVSLDSGIGVDLNGEIWTINADGSNPFNLTKPEISA